MATTPKKSVQALLPGNPSEETESSEDNVSSGRVKMEGTPPFLKQLNALLNDRPFEYVPAFIAEKIIRSTRDLETVRLVSKDFRTNASSWEVMSRRLLQLKCGLNDLTTSQWQQLLQRRVKNLSIPKVRDIGDTFDKIAALPTLSSVWLRSDSGLADERDPKVRQTHQKLLNIEYLHVTLGPGGTSRIIDDCLMFVPRLVSLHLFLWNPLPDVLKIAQFPRLKNLTLSSTAGNPSDVIQLIRNIPNLESLELRFPGDSDAQRKLRKTTMGKLYSLRLQCFADGSDGNFFTFFNTPALTILDVSLFGHTCNVLRHAGQLVNLEKLRIKSHYGFKPTQQDMQVIAQLEKLRFFTADYGVVRPIGISRSPVKIFVKANRGLPSGFFWWSDKALWFPNVEEIWLSERVVSQKLFDQLRESFKKLRILRGWKDSSVQWPKYVLNDSVSVEAQ